MNPNDPRKNCKLKEACECLGRNAAPNRTTLRMFCEQWQEPEKQIAELHAQSIKNWRRLPDQVRVPCLDKLRSMIPQWLAEGWRDQKARGVAIGSDRVRFHFDEGMKVRNMLRLVHPDTFLPTGNWDDYYYGAIDELASTRPTSVPTVSRVPDGSCEYCGVDAGTLHNDDCPKLHSNYAISCAVVERPDGSREAVMPRSADPRPYHAGRFNPLKDRIVIQTGEAEVCNHHRATLECPICKRLAAAVKVSIPVGVHYNKEHDNFYSANGNGMGLAFFDAWHKHKDQFPTRPADIS